jgi:hypothetical protein
MIKTNKEPLAVLTKGKGKIVSILGTIKKILPTGATETIDFEEQFAERVGLKKDDNVDYFTIEKDGLILALAVRPQFSASRGEVIMVTDDGGTLMDATGNIIPFTQAYTKKMGIGENSEVEYWFVDHALPAVCVNPI